MSQQNNIKRIPGYETLYGVTDDGRVYSYVNKMFLSAWLNRNGRLKVCLCVDYKKSEKFVHRLVYEAWVGTIPIGMHVDHKDENCTNNRLDNLQLLTPAENIRKNNEFRKLDKLKLASSIKI